MIVVVVYLTVAVAVTPYCVRARYARLRSSHPHTHPRDVRYDLTHATTGGVWRAAGWGPRAVWWAGQRILVWVGLKAVGRRRVGLHLRAARIEMYEAELAARRAGDEELLGTVKHLRRRVEEQEARLSRMLSA